jgi:two-component system, OmpR family, sensor histidine kinase VicK
MTACLEIRSCDLALDKISDTTEIIIRHEGAIEKIVEILSTAKSRVDLYLDSDDLNVLLSNNILKKTCVKLRSKRIQIRCISKISKENSSLVRKVIINVDDFRHLEEIKGSFVVTDTHCLISSIIRSKQPTRQIITSNLESLVQQHRQLFDIMWDKAIPSLYRVKEIQEEKLPEITETMIDPLKTQNRVWEMAKSAKEEILIMLSSANAFARQENAGSIEILKELSLKRRDLRIRFLIPKSNHVEEVRSEIKSRHSNFDIKFIQEFSQTKISIIVVDRKSSMVIELRNDNAIDTLDAMGQSTYSTRILTVLSYVSIFESYWTLSEMHEESENELAYTKEYLNKVLNEMDIKKK